MSWCNVKILYTWVESSLKCKLRVFEMSVRRKICGVTRRDHVRNLDILKDLATDKDIIDIVQIRRLT